VAIYDPATGSEIAVLTNHTMWVASMAFSRTDPLLATSSADGKIRLWDTTTWKGGETNTFKGHSSLVDSVAVSPDGRWLASGGKDCTVRIWDSKTNAAPEFWNLAYERRDSSVSRSGEFLAVATTNETLSLWNLFERREIKRFLVESNTTVLATSSQGTAFVLGNSLSRKLRVHRIDQANSDIELEGALSDTCLAAFSVDGKQFAVAEKDRVLRIGATDGSTPVRLFRHPSDAPHDILFSHDGRQVFAATASGKVRAYDTATGEIAWELGAHKVNVNGVALAPDGVRLATTSLDETVGLWDLTTRRKLGSYGKSSLGYRSVTFSRDGKRIAAAAGENLVQVWDVASRREVARFKKTERIGTVRFADDDRTLVITTAGQLSLYRAPTFAEIEAAKASTFQSHPPSAR